MNARFFFAALIAATMFITSCQTTPFWEDDDPSSGGIQWDTVGLTMSPKILGLHATPFELYAISENSFARLNSNLELIERRTLPISNAIPALNDNSFARLTVNDQNRQVVEFRLTRNPDEIFRLLVDTLSAPAGNTLEIEELANAIGAYSTDGTQFLMASKVLPARYYSLHLFSVQQNFQNNTFASIKLVKRMDLPELEASADGVIKSIKFVSGNFYLASQQGAWRITPAGIATRIFSQWKEDCFSWQGDLYMTGTVDYDLEKSIDNGLDWERVNIPTDLRHVAVADTFVFTQTLPGKVFQLMPSDFKVAKDITYPSAADPSSSFFYGLVEFNKRFYFSIDNSIYFTDQIVVD
ncbi:MAG: hypothetical protein MUC59_00800 [Saprospiraceae bacterium]|nr:hypothetical protein [Saprospiraceae bacterium]